MRTRITTAEMREIFDGRVRDAMDSAFDIVDRPLTDQLRQELTTILDREFSGRDMSDRTLDQIRSRIYQFVNDYMTRISPNVTYATTPTGRVAVEPFEYRNAPRIDPATFQMVPDITDTPRYPILGIHRRKPKVDNLLKIDLPESPWDTAKQLHIRFLVGHTQLFARSNKDWGQAPEYNSDYRRIRWPEYMRQSNIYTVRYHLLNKSRGRWTHNSTGASLGRDLQYCMRNNIPFKTPSLEYVPKNTTLYIKGTGSMKWDLMTLSPINFSFGGTYDKVISMFLRRFGIDVKLYNKKLVWEGISININDTYTIPHKYVLHPKQLSKAVDVGFVYDSGITYMESREVYIERWLQLEGVELPNSVIIESNISRTASRTFRNSSYIRIPQTELNNILNGL